MEPNYPLLEHICKGSDRNVDPHLKKMLLDLVDKPLDEYRAGLHKALDFSAHASWTSDFRPPGAKNPLLSNNGNNEQCYCEIVERV